MKSLELIEYLIDTVEALLRILREQNRQLAEYDSVYADNVTAALDEIGERLHGTMGEDWR